MYGNWRFDILDDHRNVVETRIRPVKMRQTYKQEMEYLIELCGFDIVDIFADYQFTPASDGNLIWILRKNQVIVLSEL